MDAPERARIVGLLDSAFGGARDVTPAPALPLHVELASLLLPDPWLPSPTRGLVIFDNWPNERPRFYVDEKVVGENGQPPESNSTAFEAGETWRGFSFTFNWAGDDPVRAVQLWLHRFLKRT